MKTNPFIYLTPTRRPKLLAFGLTIVLMLWAGATAAAFEVDTPVTPQASPEARSLLAYFGSIYGKKIISGQQEHWRHEDDSSFEETYLHDTTGKLPGLVAMDLAGYASRSWRHDGEHLLARHAIEVFEQQHALVSFCWHWMPPTNEPAFYTKDTTFDIRRAVTPGTPEYAGVRKDLDLIADELTVLRDAHVPVLWRPLHEANGRWFWWGAHGPEPFKQLWHMMFEELAQERHLTNLIWEFSPGAETDLAAWYPGDAYVDIIGQDSYPMDGNHGVARDIFDELNTLGSGRKLIALGENGPVPDPVALVREKAGWLFFTTWSGDILTKANTPAQLRELYHSRYVLNQGDLPNVRNIPAPPISAPVRLMFHSFPHTLAVKGTSYLPITVAVADKHGRTVRDGQYQVTVQLNGDRPARLSGTATAVTVNGIATFPDLSIDTPGTKYQLIARAVDLKPAESAKFEVGPGTGLSCEWWTNFTSFTNLPTGRKILADAVIQPVAMADHFAARMRGSLVAPRSGTYRFWLDNESTSELWLSTDATAEHAVKIAAVTGTTPYRKWPHTHEAESSSVELTAGERYYLEIRQFQPGGSTQLALRWQMPDGREERPMPAFRFIAE